MKDNSRVRLLLKRLATSIAMLLLFTFTALAQTDTGRIEGTVTDANGAVIAGATVTAINVEQNTRTEVVTNDEGFYSIPALRPGAYTLEISAPNFSRQTRPDVVLQVSQVARIDSQLQAGAVTESVEVSGGAPLVDVGSSAIGEVIQGRQIVELPLNGRNVLELARLVPGVTAGVPGGFATGAGGNAETFRGGNTGGAALSVNGQRTQANNFLLDGVDNNESLVNTIQIFPQADATQEFRVQTSVAPAEFGRGGGGIVNVATRSGRNDYFGSAFIFVRNDNFDARRSEDAVKNEFRRGQFGG
ncbi:MAG: carboxypeptidase regulatory-like domain-containing protein, partial [Pyrinomonadaceae bacterium]|nr:carboxypeptidase regulatory-like domain-containing protein [Pyrinomonadaceae bacterium]